MKKIIIPLLILLVFFGPFLLNYNFERTKEDGTKSYSSVWKFISNDNGYFKKSTRAEVYQDDCKKPYTNDQFIEFQFGDIVFKFPCTVIGRRAGLMIVGDNDGYKKHYYLRMDFKWSEETGLIWWNHGVYGKDFEKYKNYDFRVFGRLILKKNSERTTSEEGIVYPWRNSRTKKIPENAKLLSPLKQSLGISVYEITRNDTKTINKTIMIKADNMLDYEKYEVIMSCHSVNKGINTNNFLESRIVSSQEIAKTSEFNRDCASGWYFANKSYVTLVDFKFKDAVFFKQIYEEINAQLESFVVTKEKTLIYHTKEK